ncbi:MAG TPA: TIR domain-containing protein [Chthoniobacterales bacterium]|jgi:TolB-like protein/Tfp pilus assembly protein PilF|nr:TIR domain-containing protein [Chthoniobacterales bacterium]
MPASAYDVFISYSQEDKSTAEAICRELEKSGVPCWIAPRDIAEGADWTAAIMAGMNQCRVMVMVFSAHANASAHVYREVSHAFNRRLTVIPVPVEETEVSDRFEYFLESVQWLNAFPPPVEQYFPRLTERVKSLLAGDSDSKLRSTTRPPKRVPVTTTTAGRNEPPNLAVPVPRRKLLGIGLAFAVLAAGLLAYQLFRSRPTTEPIPAASQAAAVISDSSIAVLPFADMSQAKDQVYFSDGISEELLNLLAKIPQLKVAARTSSFSFKGKQVEIPEIARKLRVAHVLEGSVRTSGDQLRITAQLIRAADGYHLWSETYDRKLDDIFKIQDEIAGKVVQELKIKLLGAVPKVRTTDPKAYALYLQAVALGRQNTPEAFEQSDGLYRRVLEIDPRNAGAWNGLGVNFSNKTGMGLLSSREGFARAREAAEKALEIDPNYALAHSGLGFVATYGDNDLAAAAGHFQRALALAPTDISVLGNAATFLLSLGRAEEGLALREAIVRRDPINVAAFSNLGQFQRRTGHYDAAIGSYRTLLSLSPGNGGARFQLGVVLLLRGDATGALTEIEQEKSEERMTGLPMAYCALGRKAEADAALAALIAKSEEDSSYNIAFVYAFCGDADKAFEWLDKAVAYQDSGLSEIVTENLFDKIHSDPRWLPFLRKIGKAPEQLAKIEFKVPPLP